MMIEKHEKKKKLLLGAFVNAAFVLRFRKYCKENDFKQRTLLRNVVKFWMRLDYITQEHVYRGRVEQACHEICKRVAEQQADDIVSEAEGDAAKRERKKDSIQRARDR